MWVFLRCIYCNTTCSAVFHLGTIIDDPLNFDDNTDAVLSKAHQRVYFYHSFDVDKCVMKIFYSCSIESVLTFSFICWFGSLSLKNKKSLDCIVRRCSEVAGIQLDELSLPYRTRVTRKAQAVLTNHTHPLSAKFKLLPLGIGPAKMLVKYAQKLFCTCHHWSV